MNQDLREIAASKKAAALKAARERQLLTRLLCGSFLALALVATAGALQSGQTTPTLISAQAATLTEPEADKAVAVLVTTKPRQRRQRRQRRTARRRVARAAAAACACACGNQVARK